MASMKSAKTAVPIVLVILLVLAPLYVGNPYYLHLLIWMCLLVMLASGLRTLFTVGQISFAHAGFMAIGAYASTLLVMRLGLSFWIALPLSGIIAAVVSLGVGYPTLRIKGVYFFMASFSFGLIVLLVVSTYWDSVLGGYSGIGSIPRPNSIAIPGLASIDFVGKIPFYYLALVITMVCVVVLYRLDGSRVGMTWKAIREADGLAETCGINIMNYKVLAFAIACFFAGIAGSYLAHYFRAIGPETFSFELSVSMVIYMLVGGSASVFGPILGVVVLSVLSEVFKAVGGIGWEHLFYGVALMVFISFMPEGLIGLPRYVASWTGQVGRASRRQDMRKQQSKSAGP